LPPGVVCADYSNAGNIGEGNKPIFVSNNTPLARKGEAMFGR